MPFTFNVSVLPLTVARVTVSPAKAILPFLNLNEALPPGPALPPSATKENRALPLAFFASRLDFAGLVNLPLPSPRWAPGAMEKFASLMSKK